MKLGISCHMLKYGGGTERYAMDLVRGLHAEQLLPTFFARRLDTLIPEYAMVEPCEIATHWVPGKMRDALFSLLLSRQKHKFNINVLIACNRTTVSDIAICGGTHRGYLNATQRPAKLNDKWQIRLETKHYRHAKIIIAHSKLMAKELTEYYSIPANKIEVLYPPIDDRFSPVEPAKRQTLREVLGFPSDKFVFLFPSNSHGRKGFNLLENYFSQTDLPIVLAVAGRPVKSTHPNIQFLGYRKDIENVYRAADFTLMPSHYEPFGLIGIESALCGTPVILAENVACGEVLQPQAKISFHHGDPASLDKAIKTALQQREAMQKALIQPTNSINYDTRIKTHVRRLLAIAQTMGHP